MQLKFVVVLPDGKVWVVGSGRLEDLQRQFGESFGESDLRALVLRKSIPEGAEAIEMPKGWEPPSDRTFRDAWRGKGKSGEGVEHPECDLIEVDMPHAREIHRGWLRRKRISMLAELDVQYQRADEAGDKGAKQGIAKEKQRLRDLPADPRIEAAKTPDELKAIVL